MDQQKNGGDFYVFAVDNPINEKLHFQQYIHPIMQKASWYNIIYKKIIGRPIERTCLGGPEFSHPHISTYLGYQASCLLLLIGTGAALFCLPSK